MVFILIFILGIFIGSFLYVLVDRLPRGESVIKGRSHCEKCKKPLRWHDLIPLFSFLQLGGRCRYCRSPLSFYYPTIELATGILFVLAYSFLARESITYQVLSIKYVGELFYYLFIVSSLIVVFFADLKYGIIPDKIVYPAIIVSLAYIILNTYYIIPILSALGAGLFFLLLSLIKIKKRSAMGFGDVKFAFLMGLVLGFPKIIVSLYIAFLTGAIVGCILIVWRKKRTFGTSIPFGPFLVTGTLIAIFYGELLAQSFLRLAFP